MLRSVLTTVAWSCACVALGSPLAATTIEWRVKDPFRFIADPEFSSFYRSATEAARKRFSTTKPTVLQIEQHLSTNHQDQRNQPRAHGDSWAGRYLSSVNYDSRNEYPAFRGRHNKANTYVAPKTHDIEATATDAPSSRCIWQVTPASNTPKFSEEKPCRAKVVLPIPYSTDPAQNGASLSLYQLPNRRKLAEIQIAVRDLLIVGLGDSMAAGEGNPDIPAKLSNGPPIPYGNVLRNAPAKEVFNESNRASGLKIPMHGPSRKGFKGTSIYNEQGELPAQFVASKAEWISRDCHRSLYSHHVRTAMQLAFDRIDTAVTLLHYGCTGSTIDEGIIKGKPRRECTGSGTTVRSQLRALADDLCAGEYQEQDADFFPEREGQKCRTGRRRPIDLVLLSVGVNDVHFSSLVLRSILAPDTALHASFEFGNELAEIIETHDASEHAADQLPSSYKRLNGLLQNIFGRGYSLSTRLVITQYPNFVRDERGAYCGGAGGLSVLPQPEFSYQVEELRKAEAILDKLNDAIKGTSVFGWSVATMVRDFSRHRICDFDRSATNPQEYSEFPRYKFGARASWTAGGRNLRFNPTDYQPYGRQRRWVRTPNDAFLAVHFHTTRIGQSCDVALGDKWVSAATGALVGIERDFFQLIYGAMYSGAMHPNHLGQAAIADRVLERARSIVFNSASLK